MNKFIVLFFLILIHFSCQSQDISYDTTYQVTYENGIKDSVIIITKKVVVKELVYIVDSTINNKWAVDFYISPFNLNIAPPVRQFNVPELSVVNKVVHQIGQSIGTSLYYRKNKWEWRGGIQCSRYNSHLSSHRTVQNSEIQTSMVNDTLDSYFSIDEFEDTTYYYIIEPKQVTNTFNSVSEQNSKTNFLTYYFELNLQAGYRTNFNKWNIYLFAGPVVGFLIASKGKSFDSKGEKVDIQNVHLPSCVVSAQFNCQVAYDFKKNSQLFFEPYFQKFLLTPNTNVSWTKRSDLIGMKAGLKIFL